MEQRRTVLLADTSTEFRILLREAMERTGEFLVEIAQTGDEVLDKVQEQEPDILIMDEPTAGLDPKGRDEILDQIAELHKVRGITIILVSHSMEDVAKYVERLIVVNHGKIAFDDIPKKVFAHYKELEEMGLAAPQITYIMHALKEKGLPVDPADTTVEEAKQDILHALREMNSSLLKGGVQND